MLDKNGYEVACAVCGSEGHSTKDHPLVPGETIYVGTALFLSHGEDDFIGGKATVKSVRPGISGGKPALYVAVKENAGTEYNWEFLAEKQAKLRAEHGDRVAHAAPDYTPEFNEFAGPGDTVTETRYDTRTGTPQTTTRTLGPGEHIA